MAQSYIHTPQFVSSDSSLTADYLETVYPRSSSFHMEPKDSSSLQCHLCMKVFSRKGNLVQHLKIHTGARPHKCDVCNKTFIRNSHLREHKSLHRKSSNVMP
ncbi:unnamed protein product [Owenia fusiformis]|uniref:C2H2-type domain-containing protein n=1 Tax=Owenia fusiformis TaxID=6347 RepID=A0A8S4NBI0_OWEFU|nr:unnamed protein product [Owenia fusiformis]